MPFRVGGGDSDPIYRYILTLTTNKVTINWGTIMRRCSFDRRYGVFESRQIVHNADEAAQRSASRYIRYVQETNHRSYLIAVSKIGVEQMGAGQ